ncbi:acetate--CoA ligase family protein [Aeromicrobium tamlense]|uniref:Acetate--CoA ligase family protein n=1 Tax=Aeromicrobium tamlense TaxID=375541 RepID=A0A8I0KMF5_9ACTN|nr:acetate--CoA ligase family protein [Aeromicrobium tamlense]MBD1270765.1 acetate--CoA ligase family protein [Aeromicrobium tamlense]MBD1271103.1 acetate--CoA ligase family protein [Aeromicrobium tamlense]NYI38157.1 acetyltransferase [Aeromicrobium tamlense]
MPDLSALFAPQHIALLGVSKDPTRDSNAYLRVLVDNGYRGRITVLGAGAYGDPNVIKSVDELPEDVDVVFNMLRPELAESTLVTAAERGAKFGIVFAGGFAEAGVEGAAQQERIVANCNAHGMRIVGPNCMGLFNTWHDTNLSEIDDVLRGPIGVVSQSGNNGLTMVHEARRYGLGLSSFVSFGNQADIPAHAYIKHLGDDPNTKVIAFYLEGLPPGLSEEFIETCREVSQHTPIVGLKGGRGSAGSRAAASHTASLSQAPQAYSALFRQAGIIEVEHLHHLYPAAEALVRCPPLAGDRISVVGSGGGHSTVIADAIESVGLAVPEYPVEVQEDISTRLPFGAPVKNPVDMTGMYLKDATLFASLSQVTLDRAAHDGVVCFGLYGPEHWPATQPDPQLVPTEAGPALGDLQRSHDKPVVFFTVYADQQHDHLVQLREAGIPVYQDAETAAAAMRVLRERGRQLGLRGVDVPPEELASGSPSTTVLDESQSVELLRLRGVPFPFQQVVRSANEARQVVESMTRPAVIKGVLPGVGHKSELGAVKLGITTGDGAAEAVESIVSSVGEQLGIDALKGFLVVEDLGRNRELIVGVQRDDIFGALAVIGAGGVYTEQVKDVAVGVLPLDVAEVERMIDSLQSRPVWRGSRGERQVDLDALTKVVNALHELLRDDESVMSVDLNPVMVTPQGKLYAVDAAIHARAEA